MELHCPHCSEPITANAGDEFCPECGQPIKAMLAEAQAAGDPAISSDLVSAPLGANEVDPIGAVEGAPALQTDPVIAPAADPAVPALLIKVDGRPPVRFTGAPLLIGRLDEASGSIPDLPFNDPAISRRHLTVWQEGVKIIVQDGSTNGTFRAGLRLPQGAPVEIQPGDSLTMPGQMGTYTLRFELA